MKESLVNEESFISSNEKVLSGSSHPPRTKGGKVLIAVDNLRVSAYPLLDDHPEYAEGQPMYEVLEYWAGRPYDPYTPGDMEIIEQLQDNPSRVVEFRLGSFEVQSVSNKKRWKSK